MSHRIAGIDVHKRMLAVVVADAAGEELSWERRKFGTTAGELVVLSAWLKELGVEEAVMESTAQYWKPVWCALEGQCHLELAQAQSNRGPKGRKSDFKDGERLVRRYLADELILSFVPDAEQQLWRTQARTKARWRRDRARVQNRIEALLEEMRIKLSSVLTDLLGASGSRILRAIAKGATDPAELAELGDPNLRASRETLCDALSGVRQLDTRYRTVLRQLLDQVEIYDRHIAELDRELAGSLKRHSDSVERLAVVPGIGVDAAQQIVAEVGPCAERFPTAGQLCSWVGTCPGQEESAGESKSDRSPKGNCYLRRILNQSANAAIKAKGTVFQAHYQRIRGRDSDKHGKAVWAVANRLCRLVWKILHEGVPYEEKGVRPNPRAVRQRGKRLLRELKALGYQIKVEVSPEQSPA